MEHRAHSYAMWLVPSETMLRLIGLMIDDLAQQFSTIRFSPHATLCSGTWAGHISELEPKVDAIAQKSGPVQVNVIGIRETDSFFQFFYIALDSDDLNTTIQAAGSLLPSARFPSVGPHVSLIYSDDSNIDREKLRNNLAPQIPSQIKFDSLTLVTTKDNNWDNVANWRVEYTSRFVGNDH